MKTNKAKKGGFTLIELLAVIVILAVIALIATPIVIGIIEDSRKSAFKSSLYGVFDAAEYKLVQDSNTVFPTEGIDVSTLPMSNNKFTSGTVFQDEQGMYLENVSDGKYCGNGYKNDLEVVKGECLKYTDAKWFTFNKEAGTITSYDNKGPKDVVIPKNIDGITVKKIESGAFSFLDLTSISIPNTIVEIGIGAFSANFLPEDQAFIYNRNSDGTEDKTSLNSYGGRKRDNIKIPKTVKIIGEIAFYGLNMNGTVEELISIIIPDNVVEIKEGAFAENYELKSVVLSKNTKIIENSAFWKCQLASIIIPTGVTTIEIAAFEGNQLTNISIPDSVTVIGYGAFANNQLPEDQAFIYNRNMDGTNDMTSLNSYGGAKKDNVIIPDNVISIGERAFLESGINSISLSDNLTNIGSLAFSSNRLKSISLPTSVLTIGGATFEDNQLTTVTIPSSVMVVENSAFSRNRLTTVKIIGKSSSSDFTTYGSNIWGWASGYNDSKITWNATE